MSIRRVALSSHRRVRVARRRASGTAHTHYEKSSPDLLPADRLDEFLANVSARVAARHPELTSGEARLDFHVLAEVGVDRLAAGDAQTVLCPTTPALIAMVTEPAARKRALLTVYDALFSVQYVASALAGRPIDVATFYDEPLDDPQVLAMAASVARPPDPDAGFPAHFSGEVQVRLSDGRSERRSVTDSRGTPQDLMSDAGIVAKFLSTAGRGVGAEQARHIADVVSKLESLGDVSELVDACVAAPHSRA